MKRPYLKEHPKKNRSKGHLAEPDNQSDKAIIYPNVSHLTGMMPKRKLEKRLYQIIALLNTQEQKNPDML